MPDPILVVAAVVAAAVAGIAGSLSLRADRLAEPPDGKRRRRGPSAGTVVVFATVAGALGLAPPSGTALRLVGVAILLGAVGVVADRRSRRPLRPALRVGAEAAAAAAAVLLGLETGVTGTTATNLALVVGFVVAVVESLRLLDAAPRAAAVVAIPGVAAIAAIAADTGHYGVTTIALALAGGLVGLVAAGTRQAFWLGEAGCLFSGFLLATLLVAVSPATPAPLSLVVLLPVVTVPVLNAVVVAVDRLRRRRRLTERRPDGLPHRLRALPLSWSLTLLLLGAAQATVSGSVVLADRGVAPAAAPMGVAAVTALLLLVVASRSRMQRSAPRGLSPTARLAGLGLAVGLAAALVPAALALVGARSALAGGAAATERALAAARQGQVEASGAAFDQAEAAFASAAGRLDGPLVSLGLAVPVLGPNLSAARTLSALGVELAATGTTVATVAPSDLRVAGGKVPVEEIRRLAPELAEAAGVLRDAVTTTDGIPRAFLLPAVRDGVADLDVRLGDAADSAELAASAASVVPAILGADEPRRYFLAIQNNAELRATGGFIGSFGELVAEDGALRLERIGRVAELNQGGPVVKDLVAPQDYLDRYSRFDVASTWQSVNLSPDLPTVGGVIAGLYPQSGGQPIDGVIAIDPIGLAAILRLTGPVDVAPWPEPITADNVVQITLNQAYIDFEDNDDRVDFIGDVARSAVEAFSTADLGGPAGIFDALAEPARGATWPPGSPGTTSRPSWNESTSPTTSSSPPPTPCWWSIRTPVPARWTTTSGAPPATTCSSARNRKRSSWRCQLGCGSPWRTRHRRKGSPATSSAPTTSASSPGRTTATCRSTRRWRSPAPHGTVRRSTSKPRRSWGETSTRTSSASPPSPPAFSRRSSKAGSPPSLAGGTSSSSSTSPCWWMERSPCRSRCRPGGASPRSRALDSKAPTRPSPASSWLRTRPYVSGWWRISSQMAQVVDKWSRVGHTLSQHRQTGRRQRWRSP